MPKKEQTPHKSLSIPISSLNTIWIPTWKDLGLIKIKGNPCERENPSYTLGTCPKTSVMSSVRINSSIKSITYLYSTLPKGCNFWTWLPRHTLFKAHPQYSRTSCWLKASIKRRLPCNGCISGSRVNLTQISNHSYMNGFVIDLFIYFEGLRFL